MPTNKSHRKEFSAEEGEMIKQLRMEGKSADTVAAIMRCGKDRLRRFLKDNNLDKYQPVRRNRTPIDTSKPIVTRYPDFKNPECRGMAIDDFYRGPLPQRASLKKKEMEHIERTIAVCKSCQEQEKCLDYALIAEPYGIWGGTTESEREYLRIRLNITCERDVIISRKSRETSIIWRAGVSRGVQPVIKHSEIVEKRLSRRA